MSWKCLFGHQWNGCKCEICGKERGNSHNWNGCICTICGKTRNEGHLPESGKCRLCGTKMLSINSFTSDEIKLIGEIMTITLAGGKQTGQKTIETHAEALVKMFFTARFTGEGWLTQSDIGFISQNAAMYVAAVGSAGNTADAAKYGKLLPKIIELDDNASPLLKSMSFISI